ncbi:MAG: DNA polymerase III subunit alpha [Candidatus Binatia bacterium]
MGRRMTPFVHLHVHSHYSPMSGVSSLEELCRAARSQGAKTLALTDTNGLYGAVRFVEIAGQHGLKPILGAELTHGSHRAVCLVKNTEGYANLCRLISARHCDRPFNLIQAVERHRRGLIVLSDDLPALASWKENSPEDLYVELTPGSRMQEAVRFGRAASLPPVATNKVHFSAAEGYPLHRLLRAIDLNTTLSRLPKDACAASTHWLAPPPTLEPYYAHVPEALANTLRVAEACRTAWDFRETIFPAFRTFSDAKAFAVLKKKTYAGARRRYREWTPKVRGRIERELAIIREKGFSHYFLIVEEIVRGHLTCGRGSAAASIVSYCLGVTDVDPIRHNLLFERFLSSARNDPPDIDVDFPWDERDGVVQSVFDQYKSEKVAMVANQNTLALRGALREIAKVYGMVPADIDRTASMILKRLNFLHLAENSTARSWAESLCATTEFPEPWPEIIDRAFQVEGHFRNLGLHCGGIVIVPDEIRKYVPVEISAKGIPVLQWEKDQVEEAGLVKIDLLGNRSLAVVRDALKAVERNTGIQLNDPTWDPICDEKTKDLIRRGETIGCFYIESPATRLLLKKLWTRMPAERRREADVFEYLVMVSSLVRPAAITFVNEFVRRAHGEPYTPLHPALAKTLSETHGIMVYQEDVTNVAVALAGFSLADGEQLRKILNKKHKRLVLKDYRDRFFSDARTRGVPPATVDAVWKMIMSFAGYSFCKPHSASYARLSFKCAYLKAHHPAAFMAAVISNEGGFYPTFAYVSEARRMGIGFLPPDVNASDWVYTAAEKNIRVGFMQLKGLERVWIERVIAERNKYGPFESFDDFWARAKPKLAQARILIKAGCFDSIAQELSRPGLLWRAHARVAARYGESLPNPPDYSDEQKFEHEIEIFGFPLSCHPLERCRAKSECVPARDMNLHIGKYITMTGWLVSAKMTQTKKGDPMEFVTFEDLSTIYETTLFPDTYRKFYQLLAAGRPYLLRGRVEEEFGVATLNVRDVEHLERLDMRRGPAIFKSDSSFGGTHGFKGHQARPVGG